MGNQPRFAIGFLENRNVASALDGTGEHFLMIETGSGDATGQDLALFGGVAGQRIAILEINVENLIFAEATDFRARHPQFAAAPSFTFLRHVLG